MRKFIQLSIPEPCHERWDRMLPAEKGRFCGSCQKQVIDFTSMSDEQLARFFKKTAGTGVCGRFVQHQLDRNIEMPKKRIPWVKYFFQFALPAFLVSAKTAAQGQVKIDTGDTIITPKQAIRHFEEVKETGPGKQITGKVTDVNGGGIPYASVFIKGTTIGVATDSIGNFTLKYPGNENRLVLISSSVGYRITESVVDLNEMGQIFTIYMDYNTLEEFVVSTRDLYKMGGFVGGLVVKKISIVDTILSKVFITGPTLKLYPNPIKKNASLTIESDKAKEGSYFVQVIALNGQIVYNKEIRIEMNDRFIKVDIPPVACGTYLVSVVNKQSGKARTEKLVIE